MRTALTIAGSDPSGGAGVQGDLKTFTAHGVYGMAVITALTAQNTLGVRGVHDVPPDFVSAQLDAVFEDMPVHAAKTGMLSVPATIEAVAAALERYEPPFLVVDPVMVSTSGHALLSDDAVDTLARRLFPMATIITPNLPEAERLCGRPLPDPAAMRDAARELCARGADSVLIKGGHLAGAELVDVLLHEGAFHEYRAARIDTPHTHGTGCALASSIAAGLAHGRPLVDAVADARRFVRHGLANPIVLGRGNNPLNHLHGRD